MIEHNKEAIKILIDFAEGSMDIKTFKQEYDNNPNIQETLDSDPFFPKKIFYC